MNTDNWKENCGKALPAFLTQRKFVIMERNGGKKNVKAERDHLPGANPKELELVIP